MWTNYPVPEHVGKAFKLRQRIKKLLSCGHVLHKTFNLVMLRCCLAEHGEEMYRNLHVKRTCRAFVFLILSYRLWRSRCCRRSSFLISPLFLYLTPQALSFKILSSENKGYLPIKAIYCFLIIDYRWSIKQRIFVKKHTQDTS